MNKADEITVNELLKIQNNLVWNVSPHMASLQPPRLYAGSFWSHPYKVHIFFICLFLFVNKQLIFVYFFERSWVLQKNCYKIKKQVYCAISEMPSISAFKTGSLPLDVLPWVQFLNFLREIDFTKIFQNILFYFVLCLFVCKQRVDFCLLFLHMQVRVRNHAKMVDVYLATFNSKKGLLGNAKSVAEDIIQNPQNYHIYDGISTMTNISRYY